MKKLVSVSFMIFIFSAVGYNQTKLKSPEEVFRQFWSFASTGYFTNAVKFMDKNSEFYKTSVGNVEPEKKSKTPSWNLGPFSAFWSDAKNVIIVKREQTEVFNNTPFFKFKGVAKDNRKTEFDVKILLTYKNNEWKIFDGEIRERLKIPNPDYKPAF